MERNVGKPYSQVGGCFGLLEILLVKQYGATLLELDVEQVYDDIQRYDILTFGKRPGHCGMAVDSNRVIHADLDRGVVIDPIASVWKSANILRVRT